MDFKKYFEECDAILNGHFILTSGLRSSTYIQCAKIFIDTKRAEIICAELARKVKDKFKNQTIDYIVSPAMGGIIVGYELARHLNLPNMFCERVDHEFQLRRGFELNKGSKVLVVEDVITTGKSSKEVFDVIRSYDAEVIGEACLIDRTSDGAENSIGLPVASLLRLEIPTYSPDSLPEDLKNIPPVKPGSRRKV